MFLQSFLYKDQNLKTLCGKIVPKLGVRMGDTNFSNFGWGMKKGGADFSEILLYGSKYKGGLGSGPNI